jgi:hypothetical protein
MGDHVKLNNWKANIDPSNPDVLVWEKNNLKFTWKKNVI